MDYNEVDFVTHSTLPMRKKIIALSILLAINLLNYMDRFTVASVLTRLKDYFVLNDSKAGLLQTIFIVFYMIFAILFGYLGDRYKRKPIIIVGLLIWSFTVFLSTFVGPQHFWLFLLCRGIVGIGEASYSTIAPVMIADMFIGYYRSISLMIFYFAIPFGSGLGFICGSAVSEWSDSWQWGLRLTPIAGFICLVLLILFLEEPKRGEAEHSVLEKTTLKEDIKYLLTIPTFISSTIGLTCVVFVVGSLSWWTNTLLEHAWSLYHNNNTVPPEIKTKISSIFGLITCFAGICGVSMGSSLAQIWKKGCIYLKADERSDTYVCALGALIAAPSIYLAITFSKISEFFCWVTIFVGITCCCFNWAVNMDILLCTVVVHCRAFATALQTLISHLLGDALSPYLVGFLSDLLKGEDESVASQYFSLQRSLYLANFALLGGGVMYLLASQFVLEDKQKVYLLTRESDASIHSSSTYSDDDSLNT